MTSSSLSDLKLVSRTSTNRIIFYDSGDKPIVAITLKDQVVIDYTENVLAIVVNQNQVYKMSVNSLYDIDGKSFTPISLSDYNPATYRLKLQEAYEWLQSTVLISCCEDGPSPTEIRFYSNRSSFPSPGTSGILYIDEYTNTIYRWEAPNYIRVGGSSSGEVTGIIFGGGLTATIGGTTFDLSEGIGQVVTSSSSLDGYNGDIQIVSWATQTAVPVTNISTDPFTYILVDSTGSVVQQTTPFTDAQYKTHIVIGVISHINLSTIDLVTESQNVMYQTGHRVLELINSFGVIKKSGLNISPRPGTLEVNRDSGEVFKIGCNYIVSPFEPDVSVMPSVLSANMWRIYRDGSGGYVYDDNGGTYYTDIDPTQYDDGSGTLASVGGSRWTTQRLYAFPDNPNDIVCYYGIERYDSFEQARSGLEFEQFTEADITLENAVFLGFLFVKRTASDLSLTTEARFLQSGAFRGMLVGGGGGASYVPLTRNITINGVTQDLSADRTWTVSGGIQQATASGTDTYTATISGVASYTDGDAYLIRFTNGNTTGCTLNINGLGARTLYRNNDGVLIGGDIINGAEMLCIYNTTLTGFQVIGTAPNTLLAYVTNADSVTITKGQVVYAFGGQGDRMTVKLASNTADATSAQTVGLVLSTSIAANQKGFIMMQGLLDGLSILPTATYSDGDPIYLGATPGSITKVKPYAPNHLVYLGVVTTASNGSAGRMYVKVQNGYELDELHNVQAQTPSFKDTLWYDNTVSPPQWKTASLATILGYTPVPDTRNITINGTTQNLSADRTWTISSGNVDLSEISVTTSNAREDNYAPSGWPGASTNVTKVIRIETTNTNNITSISGLTSGAAGKTLTIVNSSANGMLILEHESTSSTAANRFSLNQNSTYFLLPNRIITFIYTGSRWTQMTLSNVGGFDLYDEMTNGQQQYTGTHVSNLYNWVTSPNSNAIRSEGALDEQLGSIGFTTLTSATSSMRAAMGTRTDTGGFIKSTTAKPIFSLIKFRFPVAPTVAQDFEAFFGFTNSTTTTTTSGGYWWYLPTAASGNTFWQNISANNTGGSLSTVNTTLSASTVTDIYLGVFFTGNNGDCVFIFSTNGITYSIGSKFSWSSGVYEGKPFFGMNKTVGTTARVIIVDSAGISYNIRR